MQKKIHQTDSTGLFLIKYNRNHFKRFLITYGDYRPQKCTQVLWDAAIFRAIVICGDFCGHFNK